MKRITYFLIPLLLSANTNALDSFVVDFKLIIDNLEVAKEVRVLDRYVDKYVYTANAKTTGIAKLLGDISIEAKSVFTINDNGVNSHKYIMNEKRDKAITKSYALNFSSEAVEPHQGAKAIFPDLIALSTSFLVSAFTILDFKNFFALRNKLF